MFGPFVLDSLKRRLLKDGHPVAITVKTLDVLLVLLNNRHRVVGKDELMAAVWPNTAVQENNLVRQISSLRRALGQRLDQHDYIVTISGRGYQFVADVEDISDSQGFEPGAQYTLEPSAADVPSLALLPALPPHAPIAPPRRRANSLIFAAFALLFTTVLAILVTRSRVAPDTRRSLQRITYEDASFPRDAAWSPDGQWVVYASDRSGKADLWKQRVGDPDPVRLTISDTQESQPDWSPDGQLIVFRSERDGGGLYVMPAGGGSARLVSTFGYEPTWSPDGRNILFRRSIVIPDLPTVYIVGLDGKPARALRPDLLNQFTTVQAAWHPDGRHISLWGTVARDQWRFVTISLETSSSSAPETVTRQELDLARVEPGKFVWAPSRRYIYFEGRSGETKNIWRITVDPSTERWISGPERLTTGAGEETGLALSRDGSRVLFATTATRTRLWAFPFDSASGRVTGQPLPITPGTSGEVDFDARSDGSRVVYRTVRAGRNELRERSLSGGEDRLLLSSADWRLIKPRWSPDGGQLAFSRCALQGTALAVAVLDTEGDADERLLTQPSAVEMQAFDWSRDGKTLVGACRFSGSDRYATCLVPTSHAAEANGENVRVIASDPKRNLFNQRFSPDQRWITFLAHDLLYSPTSAVYVMPSGGGPWRPITDGRSFDDKPRWGPDGNIVFFVSNRSGTPNVWARRFETTTGVPVGEPFAVTSFHSAQFQLTSRTVQMDIAITTTNLLLPMSEGRSDLWVLDPIDR